MINIVEVMKELSITRPVFHSEADFQHSLAWQIHLRNPDWKIRLEYPLATSGHMLGHLDLLISNNKRECAIELKYKQSSFMLHINNELFKLKNHNAPDIGRYDFLKDIQRLESYISEKANSDGWAILLTNDSHYWEPSLRQNNSEQFLLNNGRTVKGSLSWASLAGEGTILKRETPISLKGTYECAWKSYYTLTPDKGKGEFKYLLFKVSKSVILNEHHTQHNDVIVSDFS
jgi:hypothetical protein